jgi:hypothetical protein
MRQDQFEKLQLLEEKLLDVFIAEAEPTGWPGRGIPLGQMDAKTRGDVYWCRKTAASAAILAQRVGSMIGGVQRAGGGTTPPNGGEERDPKSIEHEERQIDAEYAAAEREAERLMRELQGGAGKKAFDRKVHGQR